MRSLAIGLGFEEAERSRVGGLYWEAFQRKLRPAFKTDSLGLEVLCESMRPERTLVARDEGEVIGVCGFNQEGSGPSDITWRSLRKTLSIGQSVRVLVGLSVFENEDLSGVLVLDGICVSSARRGGGVGSALLEAAAERCRESGLSAVRLTVVETNARAEALYRKSGFETIRSGSITVPTRLYGFRRYKIMQKQVP